MSEVNEKKLKEEMKEVIKKHNVAIDSLKGLPMNARIIGLVASELSLIADLKILELRYK